jgi:hypothetical protein
VRRRGRVQSRAHRRRDEGRDVLPEGRLGFVGSHTRAYRRDPLRRPPPLGRLGWRRGATDAFTTKTICKTVSLRVFAMPSPEIPWTASSPGTRPPHHALVAQHHPPRGSGLGTKPRLCGPERGRGQLCWTVPRGVVEPFVSLERRVSRFAVVVVEGILGAVVLTALTEGKLEARRHCLFPLLDRRGGRGQGEDRTCFVGSTLRMPEGVAT